MNSEQVSDSPEPSRPSLVLCCAMSCAAHSDFVSATSDKWNISTFCFLQNWLVIFLYPCRARPGLVADHRRMRWEDRGDVPPKIRVNIFRAIIMKKSGILLIFQACMYHA